MEQGAGDPGPPTYDLCELGEGLAIYERLDRLADEFLEIAERKVGAAFVKVPAFAAAAGREGGREEEYYRATTRERYLAELLACVVMGRQFWPAFVARRDTVLILPDCLRARQQGCKRKRTRYGWRCIACDPDCLVGKITKVGARHGADAYFADLGHARQFKAMRREKYRDLSVVGVACIWMLAAGMRAAEEARVPSQGVLLNFCGCEHWSEREIVTDAVVARVEQLLAAKARERRASGYGPDDAANGLVTVTPA
ncbi:MAG: DUF116 domain-containing protein [Acidobacteriota bacterium]